MSKGTRYRCDACGDAANCDIHCEVVVEIGEPTICPLTGDTCEWYEVKNDPRNQTGD